MQNIQTSHKKAHLQNFLKYINLVKNHCLINRAKSTYKLSNIIPSIIANIPKIPNIKST